MGGERPGYGGTGQRGRVAAVEAWSGCRVEGKGGWSPATVGAFQAERRRKSARDKPSECPSCSLHQYGCPPGAAAESPCDLCFVQSRSRTNGSWIQHERGCLGFVREPDWPGRGVLVRSHPRVVYVGLVQAKLCPRGRIIALQRRLFARGRHRRSGGD